MKSKTTYIKLFAGLGNQLFQYSYGQYLKASGKSIRYILSPTANCITEVFDVPGDEILSSGNALVTVARKAYAKYFAREWYVDFFPEWSYAPYSMGRLRFRKEAEYQTSPWYERLSRGNSVAIHVRGGDYLTESGFPGWGSVCDKAYYTRAIAAMREKVGDARCFVFTDDLAHARSVVPELPGVDLSYVDEAGREDDAGFHLFLMRSCRHNIIANSTYSWWGAFFGRREGQTVITPDKWKRFSTPPEWIRL